MREYYHVLTSGIEILPSEGAPLERARVDAAPERLSNDRQDTIAQLRNMRIEIKEEKIEDGREKAMESYRRFLEQTPDSALKPEAIRRLADLKVEREYGLLSGETGKWENGSFARSGTCGASRCAPTRASVPVPARNRAGESQADFEKRALRQLAPTPAW